MPRQSVRRTSTEQRKIVVFFSNKNNTLGVRYRSFVILSFFGYHMSPHIAAAVAVAAPGTCGPGSLTRSVHPFRPGKFLNEP